MIFSRYTDYIASNEKREFLFPLSLSTFK